jgi:hypothetical protein
MFDVAVAGSGSGFRFPIGSCSCGSYSTFAVGHPKPEHMNLQQNQLER